MGIFRKNESQVRRVRTKTFVVVIQILSDGQKLRYNRIQGSGQLRRYSTSSQSESHLGPVVTIMKDRDRNYIVRVH